MCFFNSHRVFARCGFSFSRRCVKILNSNSYCQHQRICTVRLQRMPQQRVLKKPNAMVSRVQANNNTHTRNSYSIYSWLEWHFHGTRWHVFKSGNIRAVLCLSKRFIFSGSIEFRVLRKMTDKYANTHLVSSARPANTYLNVASHLWHQQRQATHEWKEKEKKIDKKVESTNAIHV